MTLRTLAICSSVFFITGISAKAECANPELKNQKKDTETIQRLEKAWSSAFSHGDTAFEACLLTPDFMEIRSDGKINHLTDELALAAKHKGNPLPDGPPTPPPPVQIHGDAAVSYGLSQERLINGKPFKSYYADYYVWKDGQWHVYFAQQTLFAAS
ncbi:MAG TPA: nuclear transport factor 2 family protein [Edaphobacter sp.]|jgi:hypothetical protein|nr:nuclear transport factor 2 family protein [Edaphobacter sp.]